MEKTEILAAHQAAQEAEDKAFEEMLINIDPYIDAMNALKEQILDLAGKSSYDLEDRVIERIALELDL